MSELINEPDNHFSLKKLVFNIQDAQKNVNQYGITPTVVKNYFDVKEQLQWLSNPQARAMARVLSLDTSSHDVKKDVINVVSERIIPQEEKTADEQTRNVQQAATLLYQHFESQGVEYPLLGTGSTAVRGRVARAPDSDFDCLQIVRGTENEIEAFKKLSETGIVFYPVDSEDKGAINPALRVIERQSQGEGCYELVRSLYVNSTNGQVAVVEIFVVGEGAINEASIHHGWVNRTAKNCKSQPLGIRAFDETGDYMVDGMQKLGYPSSLGIIFDENWKVKKAMAIGYLPTIMISANTVFPEHDYFIQTQVFDQVWEMAVRLCLETNNISPQSALNGNGLVNNEVLGYFKKIYSIHSNHTDPIFESNVCNRITRIINKML